MRPDPEIDEIRAVRRRISERHGHDLGKLFKHYQDMEQRLQCTASKKPLKPKKEKTPAAKH